MKRFSSVRLRLFGIVFLAVAPALALLSYTSGSWVGSVVGILAIVATWIGAEFLIVRQTKALSKAIKELADGNLDSRAGLKDDPTELGDFLSTLANAYRQRSQALPTHEEWLDHMLNANTPAAAAVQ